LKKNYTTMVPKPSVAIVNNNNQQQRYRHRNVTPPHYARMKRYFENSLQLVMKVHCTAKITLF
jgi:hypothetical protein